MYHNSPFQQWSKIEDQKRKYLSTCAKWQEVYLGTWKNKHDGMMARGWHYGVATS